MKKTNKKKYNEWKCGRTNPQYKPIKRDKQSQNNPHNAYISYLHFFNPRKTKSVKKGFAPH